MKKRRFGPSHPTCRAFSLCRWCRLGRSSGWKNALGGGIASHTAQVFTKCQELSRFRRPFRAVEAKSGRSLGYWSRNFPGIAGDYFSVQSTSGRPRALGAESHMTLVFHWLGSSTLPFEDFIPGPAEVEDVHSGAPINKYVHHRTGRRRQVDSGPLCSPYHADSAYVYETSLCKY